MSGSTRGSTSTRSSASSRAVLAVLVLVVALDVFALGGLKVLGISLVPHDDKATVAAPIPIATVSTAAATGTPASSFITNTLTHPPDSQWRATGGLSWAASTAFDQACAVNGATAGPVIAGQRVFVVSGRTVTVTVRAYGAGLGLPALQGLLIRVRDCARSGQNVGAAPAREIGVAALSGWAQPAGSPGRVSTLLWRRGDVIASVAVAGGPSSLPKLALAVDAALLPRLTPVCADPRAVLTDALRSPYADRSVYQGWLVPRLLEIPPIGTPAAPPGVFPVPLDHTSTPLPSISTPIAPVPPLWPLALPTAVESPVAPTIPGPQPTSTQVPIATIDTTGPGCGWAFTGQLAPPFDPAAAQVAGDAATQSAQEQLIGSQTAWTQEVLDFWSSQGLYDSVATQYVAYAAAVRTVANAWDRITTDRNDYATALADYTSALALQADFLARRAAAQAAYDAAVAACAVPVTPTPTPTPGAPIAICPPTYPVILSEPTPTVPPSPTPPVVLGPGGVPLPTDVATPTP